MQFRRLGSTDMDFSIIGFGAWALGGGGWAFGWGPQDDRKSIDAIHRALDLGVNWIDTAAVYGLGHSEEVVSRAIQGRRDKIYIATKCGLTWNEKGKIKGHVSRDSVRKEVEDSLRRLDIDRIDLYQIHWPTRPANDLEAWETMADLVREGKIRYAAVSNFSVKQIEPLMEIKKPASLQPPYSLLERGIENGLLGFCREHEIGVVAYSPMQCGLLTGKMTAERVANLPEDDFRRKDPHFKEPNLSRTLQRVEQMKTMAQAAGRTPAQLSLAWVLSRPGVTSAIVGTRDPAQIEETVTAADRVLTEDEAQAVESLFASQ
ncbi:MAG: aldo/keto reductase [Planctomycetota bacterium]